MRHMRHHYCSLAIVGLSFAGVLPGCSGLNSNSPLAQPRQNDERVASYSGAGVVESVEVIHREGRGVASGLPGSDAAARDVYNIRVRMEDGSLQTFTQKDNTEFRVGDRARLDNGRILRY
ncbi:MULTISPECIES: hypothetical protein [unclassified Herbaspirillum]|nr:MULTISPECIES: hypothetical protein [unclassified Herbaspirillum]MBB5392619.1 hypothetical protein [Herbaspirillum sp. SJZ102]TQK06256.1 hypothetical protein FB599_2402 [Herbaspirillum sp. SJZ130]TQK12266.1 hypothetical protein FB598_2218 [Herbaspirillum sp. SJZ106]TWC68459.1 hypothetical protein FB597_103343 [Herbaspirillum sp. SJZ099]